MHISPHSFCCFDCSPRTQPLFPLRLPDRPPQRQLHPVPPQRSPVHMPLRLQWNDDVGGRPVFPWLYRFVFSLLLPSSFSFQLSLILLLLLLQTSTSAVSTVALLRSAPRPALSPPPAIAPARVFAVSPATAPSAATKPSRAAKVTLSLPLFTSLTFSLSCGSPRRGRPNSHSGRHSRPRVRLLTQHVNSSLALTSSSIVLLIAALVGALIFYRRWKANQSAVGQLGPDSCPFSAFSSVLICPLREGSASRDRISLLLQAH